MSSTIPFFDNGEGSTANTSIQRIENYRKREHKSMKDGLSCKVVPITDGSVSSSPVSRSVSQLIANSMLRIRLYELLVNKFKDTTVFQEDAGRLIQSVPVPLSFLNEISYEKCRTPPCRHVTSSLADHFVANAVEYMVYESGFESVSVECIRTLAQVMRNCIHNLGRVLSSSVLSFPAAEATPSHAQKRYSNHFLSLISFLLSKRTQPYVLLRFMQERLNACNQLSIVENELSKLCPDLLLHPAQLEELLEDVGDLSHYASIQSIVNITKEEPVTTKIPSNQELVSSLELYFGSFSVSNKQERNDRWFHSC